MTSEQQEQLRQEVAQLIRETEGYDDALNYTDEIATDLSLHSFDVLEELHRQLGMEPFERPALGPKDGTVP